MTKLGVFVGNNPLDVAPFEGFMGRPVDSVLAFTGEASWADYNGSVGWIAGELGKAGRPLVFSVPLIPAGATLAEAATGAYNAYYTKAAKDLVSRPGLIYVRTGWEFNGSWMKWAAKGNEANFIGAFRQFAGCFRAVSNRFRIEWNVNIGDQGMDPATAYPGDDHVDVIGMDFYLQPGGSSDPLTSWNATVMQKYGLQWHQDFAKAHGKPTAYTEWGVNRDGFGAYVEQAAKWFERNAVLYHHYWNSSSAYVGKLSTYPVTAAAFQRAFA